MFITGLENTENIFYCLIAIDVKSTKLFEFSDGIKFEAQCCRALVLVSFDKNPELCAVTVTVVRSSGIFLGQFLTTETFSNYIGLLNDLN